ncbi:Uncharacterised protein [Legionella pneumophila]|nr:hypothetical protein LpnA194_03063 [Legionella pneumophila]CZG29741.1 Uncharacterised protein [Legionella pneumophila]CZJ20421.1 Uncharacterised protein [Legionella pneumophila]CZQ99074.1 Uncharacterised protein [Legionella pneumophila]STX65965.1 Uncharacterised protein [Legionella pneumophila]
MFRTAVVKAAFPQVAVQVVKKKKGSLLSKVQITFFILFLDSPAIKPLG